MQPRAVRRRKFTGPRSGSSAVSVRTHLPMSRSVRRWCDVSAFLRSAETQVLLSFTSPSVIFSSIPRERLHVYLYVLQLSQPHLFKFSAFQPPSWRNAIYTRLTCDTRASQLDGRAQSLNKSPPSTTHDARRRYLCPFLSSAATTSLPPIQQRDVGASWRQLFPQTDETNKVAVFFICWIPKIVGTPRQIESLDFYSCQIEKY